MLVILEIHRGTLRNQLIIFIEPQNYTITLFAKENFFILKNQIMKISQKCDRKV
jgi:hypothetical protein